LINMLFQNQSRGPVQVLLGAALLLAVISCSPQKETTRRTDALDAWFSAQMPASEPGGAILVLKKDSVVFAKGYGLADLKTREPVTTKTLFNLGSISKTFVANAILILQEQNKLSVEDSLLQYFPGFRDKSIAGKVKVKHLLTHTSGLPDNRQVNKDTVFYLTAKDAENWYPVTQTDRFVFEPGSRYEYSNPAFNALALIVEKVSGMKWQAFIAQNIMKPSGMTASTITDGPHPESGVSHGYVKNHDEWVEDDYGEEPTFPASGNGGVWSSVDELVLYEQALKKATFLSAETIRDSRTVKHFDNWTSEAAPAVGWSWFIGQTADSVRTVGHTGSQGGFLCNYVTIPDKEILFVILCNTPRDVTGYSDRITAWLRDNDWLD
jgi:CubicO group peptidase (beta-lactamase class C family)